MIYHNLTIFLDLRDVYKRQVYDDAQLNLRAVELVNHSIFGLDLYNCTVDAANLVTNHCSNAAIAIRRGGDYRFNQCSIVNLSEAGGNSLPVFISNTSTVNGMEAGAALTQCFFTNSIIYGHFPNGVAFFWDENIPYNYQFDYNLIRNDDLSGGDNSIDYMSDTAFTNGVYDQLPLFVDASSIENNLRLQAASPGLDAASVLYNGSLMTDFFGVDRSVNPDLGAIESN